MTVFTPTKPHMHSVDAVVARGYVSLISAIAVLGGILVGFNLVVISGTAPFFVDQFQLNYFQTGWSVSCSMLGVAIGAGSGGKLSDMLGRKTLLTGCAVLFILAGAGSAWAANFPVFVLFRMLSGVTVGAAALVCPTYVAEMLPASIRARIVSFFQLSVLPGLLLAYLFNYVLVDTEFNNGVLLFCMQMAPSQLFIFGLLFVAESPRWLIRKGRVRKAIAALERIGGRYYALVEIVEIRTSVMQKNQKSVRGLFGPELWPIVFIGILAAALA